MRMRQEICLGIGGKRAMRALGFEPAVFHLNEGHSAFLSLERIRLRVEKHGLDFSSALQVVAASTIFTTHTPVPAGNESFPIDLMRKYFGSFAEEIGIGFDRLMSYGQPLVNANPNEFSMTILALRTSRHANGVSSIHGRVSRGMWKDVWAGVPEDEVPITSITNGDPHAHMARPGNRETLRNATSAVTGTVISARLITGAASLKSLRQNFGKHINSSRHGSSTSSGSASAASANAMGSHPSGCAK